MHYGVDRVRAITPYINIILYRATCLYLHIACIQYTHIYIIQSALETHEKRCVCMVASARVRAVRRGRLLLVLFRLLLFPPRWTTWRVTTASRWTALAEAVNMFDRIVWKAFRQLPWRLSIIGNRRITSAAWRLPGAIHKQLWKLHQRGNRCLFSIFRYCIIR